MRKITAWILAALMLASLCSLTAFADEESAKSERPMQLGIIEDDIYTNPYAGITIDLSGEWTIYGADLLQNLPENLSEMFADTEFADLMPDVIIDMQAENAELLASVNINFTKLSLSDRLTVALLSDEELTQLTLDQKDSILEAYATAGIEISSMEMVQADYLGQPHPAVKSIGAIQGIPYFILQIMDYRLGSYLMTVTAASFLEDTTQSILDLFTPLDAAEAA